MKIGIFDSGLGGLMITRAIHDLRPELDLLYLGDTLRLPYGNRSEEAIYAFSEQAMHYLFEQDCTLVIIACNTVSARCLRPLQQVFLKKHYPDRNILGVVIPTLEVASERRYKCLGLFATNYTAHSNIYCEELLKLDPEIKIFQQATPLLVPLIENEGHRWIDNVLETYTKPLLDHEIEGLILGCTHYALIKNNIRAVVGDKCEVLSQDEIIPEKLSDYLDRHPEYKDRLTLNGRLTVQVTDITKAYEASASHLYGEKIDIEKVVLKS